MSLDPSRVDIVAINSPDILGGEPFSEHRGPSAGTTANINKRCFAIFQ